MYMTCLMDVINNIKMHTADGGKIFGASRTDDSKRDGGFRYLNRYTEMADWRYGSSCRACISWSKLMTRRGGTCAGGSAQCFWF
jgi:hypothetical protein